MFFIVVKKQRQLHDDNLNVDVQILGENPQAPEISMDEEIKVKTINNSTL